MQNISENEWVIYKSRWGAFYKTKLEQFLLHKEISTLIFLDVIFPIALELAYMKQAKETLKLY